MTSNICGFVIRRRSNVQRFAVLYIKAEGVFEERSGDYLLISLVTQLLK